MSRIIVKQLPKNITEEKLRTVFGKQGTLTDLQLKYTREGKFRQFCFVGYRTEEEAQAALKFFNNTCIQTSRIKVEICASLGADDKPQAWSKYAKDSKAAKNCEDTKEPATTNVKDKRKDKASRLADIIGDHKDDPEFQEFLKAHDKKRTLWGNDAANAAQDADGDEGGEDEAAANDSDVADDEETDNYGDGSEGGSPEIEPKMAEKPVSDMEYMKSLMVNSTVPDGKSLGGKESAKKSKADCGDLYTIKIHNVPYKTKRQEILAFFKPLKPFSVRLPTAVHGFCYVGFKTEKEMAKAMLKHKSFIKGKQVFFADFTEKNKLTKQAKQLDPEQQSTGAGPPAAINAKWLKQQQQHLGEEIAESGRIFFRNLAYTVTEDDLQKAFEEFGPVAELHLPIDVVTRQIKGFGTVTFMMPEHAVRAFNKLDGTDFHGRLLHLITAKAGADGQDGEDGVVAEDQLSFKQKKALKLKKAAQQSNSWNTLFLGPNAVADILARKFDTSKDKILDTNDGGGGSSAAVRIALGETQIVNEMRKFLEEHGVCLSAFDAPLPKAKRSKCIILAKNLPADTAVSDISPLFAKFGPLSRIVLPPSGVTALIEFCEPSEARQAFKKLAYSKFKTVPLYLEWAPANVFVNAADVVPAPDVLAEKVKEAHVTLTNDNSGDNAEPAQESHAESAEVEADAVDDEPPEANTTLFLRNLNFNTVEQAVFNHFKHLGAIHSVEIAKRKDAANPRQTASLGYGFVQFKRAATVEVALKQLQQTTIDGNQVELKRSDRTLRSANEAATVRRKVAKATKQVGSKILVRNIPFQAHVQEVRDIFKAFGEIRSLRLPMKTTPGEGSTLRGFGFVDYVTKSDAKRAFEALSHSTHLYGRRLVLEWAATDDADDVDELRKRTASQFNATAGQEQAGIKRSRKAIFDVTETNDALSDAGNDEEM